jgi:methylamine dehydrogenase heavy chain
MTSARGVTALAAAAVAAPVVAAVAALVVAAVAVLAPVARAADAPGRPAIVPDEHGQVAVLPATPSPHWLWVPDRILRHATLFDGDTGRALGTLDSTFSLSGPPPLFAPKRGEIYVVDQVYARGHRGERKDYVTIYDATTLMVRGEVEIPPRSSSIGHGYAVAAVLDDQRFLVVFNQDPANSVSIVDLETRQFVDEIVIGGCALVYPTGGSQFGTLCGNGTAIEVELDASGHQARATRSAKFFDTVEDPLTEKGVRDGATWLFASFEGTLQPVDFSGEQPVAGPAWPLFTDAERTATWRVGGMQHLALHRATSRLYSLVHEGGPGSHKEPGSAIWVYDVAQHKRVQEIAVPGLLPAFVRPLVELERGGWGDWMLRRLLPNPGAHSIAVTQDERPLLFVRHDEIGAVGVVDAMSGETVREIDEVGISGPLLIVPPVP